MYAWTLQGVPNGWKSVPLRNPLGFKHHPLEGAGIYIYNLYIYNTYFSCSCLSIFLHWVPMINNNHGLALRPPPSQEAEAADLSRVFPMGDFSENHGDFCLKRKYSIYTPED